MKLKKLAIATLILLVPSLAVAIRFTQNTQVGDKVVKIIDGDTFKLQNKQTIRLASIDAPELDKCLGQDSKEALSKLILGKRIVLLESYADQWFCSEAEALKAGYTRSGDCQTELKVLN